MHSQVGGVARHVKEPHVKERHVKERRALLPLQEGFRKDLTLKEAEVLALSTLKQVMEEKVSKGGCYGLFFQWMHCHKVVVREGMGERGSTDCRACAGRCERRNGLRHLEW